MGPGKPLHQVQFGADRPRRARWGIFDRRDDLLSGADLVGGGHDLVHALGMDKDVDARDALPDLGNVVGGEAAMDRAVPAPEDHGRLAQRLGVEAATWPVRIPDDAVVQAHPEFEYRRIADEMLV